jgi:hypothetical protein
MVVVNGQNLPPPEPEPIDDTTTAVVPQQQQQPPPLSMPDPNQDLVAFPPVPVSHNIINTGAVDIGALNHPSLPSTSADSNAPPEPSPSHVGRSTIASNNDVSDPILDDAMHEVVEQQQLPPADPQQLPMTTTAVVPSVGDISDNEQLQSLPNGGGGDNVVIEVIELFFEYFDQVFVDY